MEISKHAFDRAKERLNWTKQVLEKMAFLAFNNGLKHRDTKGKLKKYMDKLWFDYKFCNNARIYGEVMYFFKGEVLITVYQIPNNLKTNLKICKNAKNN
jgi:hypothetical protein